MKTILDIFQLNITRSPDNGTDGPRLSVKCQSKIHFDQTESVNWRRWWREEVLESDDDVNGVNDDKVRMATCLSVRLTNQNILQMIFL